MSLRPLKIVGLFLGAVPLWAGLALWLLLLAYQDDQVEAHRPRPRYVRPYNGDGAFLQMLFIALLVIGGHIGTFMLLGLARKSDRDLLMSRTAWQVLLCGCYGVGLVIGAFCYFSWRPK